MDKTIVSVTSRTVCAVNSSPSMHLPAMHFTVLDTRHVDSYSVGPNTADQLFVDKTIVSVTSRTVSAVNASPSMHRPAIVVNPSEHMTMLINAWHVIV